MKIKNYLLMVVGCAMGVPTACMLQSASEQETTMPEIPQMQAFATTPHFKNEVEIFGEKIDISRYDLHERYERELTNLCYTHNSTILTIKRANRYFPIICPILKEEGLPSDFIYLACIESWLNQRAVSPAGAAGIWQFTADTAKRYGLEVNSEVDERYHLEKATRAACKYLKDSYAKFGDWLTVCASYNGGQAGIARKLAAQKQNRALDLLLAEETSRYMFRIMAMKEVMRDPYHYGFVLTADQLYRPIKTREVDAPSTIANMTAFAERLGLSYYHLKEFNPWLRDDKLTNKARKQYKILIPKPEEMNYDGKPFEVYDKNWVVEK